MDAETRFALLHLALVVGGLSTLVALGIWRLFRSSDARREAAAELREKPLETIYDLTAGALTLLFFLWVLVGSLTGIDLPRGWVATFFLGLPMILFRGAIFRR